MGNSNSCSSGSSSIKSSHSKNMRNGSWSEVVAEVVVVLVGGVVAKVVVVVVVLVVEVVVQVKQQKKKISVAVLATTIKVSKNTLQ